MVTVINRPVCHKLEFDINYANITNDSGEAVVTTETLLPHGLADGDYVYIESDLESYNGFKIVFVTSVTSFRIKNNLTDYVQFKQNANIVYRKSVYNHGYQAVHLPIVYELHSDKYPNNELDETYSPRTVTSFSNQNGYTVLDLSVDIYDPRKLDFIILKGDGPLAGPYQIVNFVDANSPVVNLAYKASNDFSPYVIEQYYNNYFIGIKVYAGLDSSHRWESEKPFELLATLKQVPDENGNVKISISEILKSQMETRNNLTLDTLPNNLDFFTEFYIESFESYDVSDNSVISTYTSEPVQDSFTGQAINSKMPFKSLDSGGMSDYVGYGIYYAQWLTTQDRPAAIVGYYFDISFINTANTDVIVKIMKRFQGYTSETEVITIDNPGKGVIRVPITAQNGFDEYCIEASNGPVNIDVDLNTSSNTGFGTSWVITGSPAIAQVTLGGFATSKTLYGVFIFGEDITVRIRMISTAAGQLTVKTMNSGLTALNFYGPYNFVGGDHIIEFVIPYDPSTVYLGFIVNNLSGSSETFSINEFSVSNGISTVITEQICIDIVEECNTFADGNMRLTEDGNIRIIE